MAEQKAKKEVILTGVAEVDEKLGGGIPLGSLCLIEGHSDAGKSVLCQHLSYGTLSTAEANVAYYTTENSVRSLISQMASLDLHVQDHFLADRFRIFPLTSRNMMQGGKLPFRIIINHFSHLPKNFKLILVDSITLLIAHGDPVATIDFFSGCKSL